MMTTSQAKERVNQARVHISLMKVNVIKDLQNRKKCGTTKMKRREILTASGQCQPGKPRQQHGVLSHSSRFSSIHLLREELLKIKTAKQKSAGKDFQ